MHAALAILIVIGISLLGFQAVSLFFADSRRTDQRWTAGLTATIAVLISLNLYLFCQHLLISDPHAGLLLTQASAAWLLRTLVFGHGLAATLVVQSAAAARDRLHRPSLLVGLGLAIAAYSAWTVHPCGQTEPSESTVYGYDLYSPWLLLWVAACVVDWGLLIAGLERRELRRWFSTSLCLGIAALGSGFAQRRGQVSELAEQWQLAYWLTFLLVLLFMLRVLLGLLAPEFFRKHASLRRGLISVLLVALVPVLALFEKPLSDRVTQQWTGASCCIVVLVTLAWVVNRARAKDRLFVKGEGTLVRYVLALSLLALVLCALDRFFFRIVPELWNLLGTSAFAIVLVELAAEGPLLNVGTAATLWGSSSTVRIALAKVAEALRGVWDSALRAWRWMRSLSMLPRLGLQLLIPVLLYVVGDELPNAHLTVIQTFEVYGAKGSDSDLGKRFAELVVNRLNGIALDLDENMLIALPASLTNGDAHKPIRQATVHTSSLEAGLANDALDLGPFGKVRIGKFLKLIQRPIRRLIGARFIEGAVFQEGERYRIVAHAGTDQSWIYPRSEDTPLDMLSLASSLAFSVLSTDPDWTERGMTLDPVAFEHFLDSIWLQQTAERLAGNEGTLKAAQDTVASLHAAVASDPGFAVAHYRLALALGEQGQLGGAVEHLRAALRAQPNFGPARDALARLLERGLRPDEPLRIRAVRPPKSGEEKTREDQQRETLRGEAHALWAAMTQAGDARWSLRDRAVAHLGLCTLALDLAAEGHDTYVDGLFHCAVAARSQAALPEAELRTENRNALLAYAFNALGVLHMLRQENSQEADAAKPPEASDAGFGCSAGEFEGVAGAPLRNEADRPQATQLFRMAHELAPRDTTILCNLATAERRGGVGEREGQRLLGLGSDRETQLAACEALMNRAVDLHSDAHFQAALQACERAIASDPRSAKALGLYAQVFRMWWLTMPVMPAEGRVHGTVAMRAEQRAREAVQLAQYATIEGMSASMKGILGGVLLSVGRPHEALSWLKPAYDEVGAFPRFQTLALDLAEALVCARKEDAERSDRKHDGDCLDASGHAEAVLAELRQREAKLEASVLADQAGPLALASIRARCERAALSFRQGFSPPPLRASATYPKAGCGTTLLRVSGPTPDLSVHVWGNGESFTSAAASFAFPLGAEPTHGRYFAQLMDPSNTPASDVAFVDTLRDASGSSCADADRVVSLSFSPASMF